MDKDKYPDIVGRLIINSSVIDSVLLSFLFTLTTDRQIVNELVRNKYSFEIIVTCLSIAVDRMREENRGNFIELLARASKIMKARNDAAHQNPFIDENDNIIGMVRPRNGDERSINHVIAAKNDSLNVISELHAIYVNEFGDDPSFYFD